MKEFERYFLCVCLFVCFFLFSLCVCSCDDVGAAASRPLVDAGDLQGDGDERTQHHLENMSSYVSDHKSAVPELGFWKCTKTWFSQHLFNVLTLPAPH